MSFQFICISCGHNHDSTQYRTLCILCQGLLKASYSRPLTTESPVLAGKQGIAKYMPTLPIKNPHNIVTLGEGNTPIIQLPSMENKIGINQIYAKLEYMNPTGSFKDRGNAVQISVLKELGVKRFAEIGAGNTGHSLASYAVRAGITMEGFTSDFEKNSTKVKVIQQTGAQLHWIHGDRAATVRAMYLYCEETKTLNLTYHLNPYFIEGNKTIAYEIAEQMHPLPDNIVMTVGNGSQLLGLWWGFNEMIEDGRATKIPKLHGIQSTAFQPMVAAFYNQNWIPNTKDSTVAVGIRIPAPPRLQEVIEACKQSGGNFLAVPDNETIKWQQQLNNLEGIFVEPTTSVTPAGVAQMVQNEIIHPEESILLILGGFGFKEPLP